MAYNALWIDTLPWSDTERDRKLVSYALINIVVLTIFFIVMQILPVPETAPKKIEELNPRLAKLIIEQKKKKTPPPPKPVPKKEVKKDKKPEKKKQVKKDKKPEPKKTPKPDKTEVARKQAQREMTAIQDALSDLREFDVAAIDKPVKSAAASKIAASNTTAVIAAKAKTGSGGINTSTLSRDTGGGNLQGRRTTQVTSTLGQGGGKKGSRSGGGSGGKGSRPYEDIELVFQKNKGKIYSIYNRALRSDPSLQGKVVLELTIAANGSVTKCRVISSELNNKTLEAKLVNRVKLFRFKPRSGVASLTITYPIDFLPS